MPLVFQQNINEHASLALWHITEEISFFDAVINNAKSINHPERKKQHLAGRFLLKLLQPDLDTESIVYTTVGKPYVNDGSFFISISHSECWVAAMVSTKHEVSIDVEVITEKAYRLRERFITAEEQAQLMKVLDNETLIATLAWSAKETMFKYCGLAEVDFIRHLKLKNIVQQDEQLYLSTIIKKNVMVEKNVNVILGETYVITYLSE